MAMGRWTLSLLGLTVGLLASQPAIAGDGPDERAFQRRYSNFSAPHDQDGTLTLIFENDSIASTDENYTNGFRLSWLSGTKAVDGFSERLCRLVGGDANTARRTGFAFGHEIYTPEDIEATAPLPDQHPYAGYIYAERTLVIEQANRVDQFSAQFGLVGPSAEGEWVQNNFHSLLGIEGAKGWDNQLPDEVVATLAYARSFRHLVAEHSDGIEIDLVPTYGFAIGTAHTYAHAGATVRWGRDLRNDFGPPRIRPALAGAGYFTPTDHFSWYLFAGVEGRAVAHDIFLDGSLFRDEATHINSNPFVADVQFGGVVQLGRSQLSLTFVNRTEEFEEQVTPQRFGALTLSRKY